jgi:hypothetical protein
MDFIYSNEHSLSKELCEEIIHFYKEDNQLGGLGVTYSGVNKKIKDTWDLNIATLLEDKKWKKIHEVLYKELYINIKIYLDKFNNDPEYNKYHLDDMDKFNILGTNVLKSECFQVQKYEKQKGKYIYHNDFKAEFKKEEYRVITYIWYLNDVEEGGETEFFGNYKIKPQAGKLVLFPASWCYPHCGCMPISSDKYIITGWAYQTKK